MGSRNVVVFGSRSGSGSAAATIKDVGKAQQAGMGMDALRDAGRKRRAESVSLSFPFSSFFLGRVWVREGNIMVMLTVMQEPVVESRGGGGGKKVKVEKEG